MVRLYYKAPPLVKQKVGPWWDNYNSSAISLCFKHANHLKMHSNTIISYFEIQGLYILLSKLYGLLQPVIIPKEKPLRRRPAFTLILLLLPMTKLPKLGVHIRLLFRDTWASSDSGDNPFMHLRPFLRSAQLIYQPRISSALSCPLYS